MKVTFCAMCISILLLLSTIAAADDTATVHGVAYEWDTLEPLDNVIIEVNSTPVQSIVAKYGIYSFELPEGSYRITASYYRNGDLTCYDEEMVMISEGGNYVVDLLLLPSYSDDFPEETVIPASNSSSFPSNSTSSSGIMVASLAIVLVLLVLLFLRLRRTDKNELTGKRKVDLSDNPHEKGRKSSDIVSDPSDDIFCKKHELQDDVVCHVSFSGMEKGSLSSSPAQPQSQCSPLLTSEHMEILDIIRSAGGTMLQKELRRHLDYSEGKASVMLAELEKLGLIRKVKKGRGNILFLARQDE